MNLAGPQVTVWPKLAVLVLVGVLAAVQPAYAEWHSANGQALEGDVRLEVWHEDSAAANSAMDAVMSELRRIEQAFSPSIPGSELFRINTRAGDAPRTVSDELAFLLERGLFYGQLTQGAFDITIAAVGQLYDYKAKQQPTAAQRKALLPAVDFQHIELSGNTVAFKHPDVQVDLGGLLEGYAVDQGIALLRDRGVIAARIDVGGESRVLADRHGEPWMVGIPEPRSLAGDEPPSVTVPLQDATLSTSADYQQYFIDPATGERIHEILDPTTGRPVSAVTSVSVIGQAGIDTDALATSVFVLGVKEGLALINDLPNFESIVIDDEGVIHYSAGLLSPEG